MINRTLIRIKVVQMLYSYLLTRSEFRIEPEPEKNTRDSRYSYALYQALLLLILELSGQKVTPPTESEKSSATAMTLLAKGDLAKRLAQNPDIRRMVMKGSTCIKDFDAILPYLYDTITNSSAFADYKKRRSKSIPEDAAFWTIILQSVIAKDPKMMEAARQHPDFTIAGFNNAIRMVVDTLNNYNDTTSSLALAKKSLNDSLAKAYELYHALLILPVYIVRMEEERLEANKEKYLPTADDLNPDLRFVNSPFVKAIAENPDMQAYLKQNPISWENNYFLIKELHDRILESDDYKQYMAKETADFADDCDFWRNVFRNIIFPSDALAEALENSSVYWNDDLVIMGTFVLKSIKQISNTHGASGLLPMYKDEDDAEFGPQLFKLAVDNRDTYRSYIDRFINSAQWDPDRLAFMDIVIMIAAIAEMLHFPSVPVPVTLNEFIEIANFYSTPRSGQFVNGLLFSVMNYLKDEGILLKPLESPKVHDKE